jgi:hypothetical protein
VDGLSGGTIGGTVVKITANKGISSAYNVNELPSGPGTIVVARGASGRGGASGRERTIEAEVEDTSMHCKVHPPPDPAVLKLTRRWSELHPAIESLMVQHKAAVTRLKSACRDALQASTKCSSMAYDDLWLLRFVLSNGAGAEAEKAVRETLAW